MSHNILDLFSQYDDARKLKQHEIASLLKKQIISLIDKEREELEALNPDRLVVAEVEKERDEWKRKADFKYQLAQINEDYIRIQRERDEALKNYQFMVDHAADQKLDGYRELGQRAADAEQQRDEARAQVTKLQKDIWDTIVAIGTALGLAPPPSPEGDAELPVEWHGKLSVKVQVLKKKCDEEKALAATLSKCVVIANSSVTELIDRLSAETARAAKLQAFKDFVHRRLDEMGIEKEPNGEHSAHGCRIGDRLDIVQQRLAGGEKPV